MVELSKKGYAPAKIEVVDVLSVVHTVVRRYQSKDNIKPAARQASSIQQARRHTNQADLSVTAGKAIAMR